MGNRIKELSIDLETFSDVDLKKCGVYRYAESPNFEFCCSPILSITVRLP